MENGKESNIPFENKANLDAKVSLGNRPKVNEPAKLKIRMGRFVLATNDIVNNQEMLAEVFVQLRFVPTRAEHLWHSKTIDYIGISCLFDEAEEGSPMANYNIGMNKDKEGKHLISVSRQNWSFPDKKVRWKGEFDACSPRRTKQD